VCLSAKLLGVYYIISYDVVGLQSGVVYIYPWTTQRFSFNDG